MYRHVCSQKTLRVVTSGALTHKITRSFDHVILRDNFISTTKVPKAIKHVKVVTYLDGLPPIKSHDRLIM